jgi:hypothetical protein
VVGLDAGITEVYTDDLGRRYESSPASFR